MRAAAMVCGALALMGLAAAGVSAGALFGSYDGHQQFPGTAYIDKMHQWLGKKQAVYHTYISFCTDASNQNWFFNQVLPSIWRAGNVPAVTWTPTVCDRPDKSVPSAVAAGRWDAYLTQFASRVKTFLAGSDGKLGTGDDRRLYLSLAHEANGNWESWSGSPAAYRLMWARVRNVFAKIGVTNKAHIQWVFTANNQDVPYDGPLRMEQYYPGDNYVDWLAVDGYNWGTAQSWSHWTPPQEVFGGMVARFKALSPNKPIGIWEVGTTSVGGTAAQREQWIQQLFGFVQSQGIKMVLWFNVDKETNWGIFQYKTGDSLAYKTAVRDAFFIGSGAGGARLLTDGQFTCRPMSAVSLVEQDADATDAVAEAAAADADAAVDDEEEAAADTADEEADAEADL